jgi:adenylate cyclase
MIARNTAFTYTYNVACGYCRLGDFDAAFDLLEKSLLNASDWIKAWIRFDSDLDPLRKLPRYEKIRALIEQA